MYLPSYKSVKRLAKFLFSSNTQEQVEDIKNFRQLNSICAGHPEYEEGSGIETTTGPLGQGLANSVGMAIAQEIFVVKEKVVRERLRNNFY